MNFDLFLEEFSSKYLNKIKTTVKEEKDPKFPPLETKIFLHYFRLAFLFLFFF